MPQSQSRAAKLFSKQMAIGGEALPWADRRAFGELLLEATLTSVKANNKAVVFHDRGLSDVAAWFEQIGEPQPRRLSYALSARPYASPVFVAPPWPEIYVQNEERPKQFDEALAEFSMIERQLDLLGLPFLELPKVGVGARVDFVLKHIRQET